MPINSRPSLSSSLKSGKQAEAKSPPFAGAFKRNSIEKTDFREFYRRGEVPCSILHSSGLELNKVAWKSDIAKIDLKLYLPMFIEGIRELTDPYRTLAIQGTRDMLEIDAGKQTSDIVPKLLRPLKKALDTKHPEVMASCLQIIQKMIKSDKTGKVGPALVPYYRQLLPTMNLFKNHFNNTFDGIDYGQRHHRDLGELISETLSLLEISGGPGAYAKIKYMVPTYESAM